MNQPRERFHVGTDEDTVEFELSAQDLLALSPPGAIQGPTPEVAQSAAELPAEGPIPSQAQTARISGPRVGLSLSIVAAVVVTGVVLYLYSRAAGAVRPVMAPQAAAPLEQASPTLASEQVPVRFVNPFDHTEVFEFPPGTSETAAREAVVEVLMERAQDRRTQATLRRARKAIS